MFKYAGYFDEIWMGIDALYLYVYNFSILQSCTLVAFLICGSRSGLICISRKNSLIRFWVSDGFNDRSVNKYRQGSSNELCIGVPPELYGQFFSIFTKK